jgi:aspartate-semialdehyde dehydrogenase
VPEVNPEIIHKHQGIIANPNCSTIQLVVVLYPLHKIAKLRGVIVSTYQSVSGKGKGALKELRTQIEELAEGKEIDNLNRGVFLYPIAGNVIPHIDNFGENRYTLEELKLIRETRKILNLPELKITATTVRVPVFYGHSESVTAEFEHKLTPSDAINILESAPG